MLDKIAIGSNITVRVISASVIALLFIIGIFYYRPFFYILFCFISTLMLSEWYDITVNSRSRFLCNIVGYLLIPLSIASIMFISYVDDIGWMLFSFFAILWSVDIMAMFGGKAVKGPKLVSKLSPNKTVSGLVIGVVSGAITANLLTFIPNYQVYVLYSASEPNIMLTLFALVLGILAQLSDLLISYFKRKAHIKDSGNIIPGHGGMLDRFDSIILVAPIIVLCFIFY